MNHKYPVRVTIYDSTRDLASPDNLNRFIEFLQNKKQEIPSEYRDNAQVEIESYVEYDSSYYSFKIYYHRPPTEEEIKKRKAQAEENLQRQISYAEDTLKRLKGQL